MEFFNPHLYDLSNPELWVAAGLILFFGILVVVGVPKLIAGQLDGAAAKIQGEEGTLQGRLVFQAVDQ